MADPITIFRGARGLYTKADPARVKDDEGMVDLPVALNVDITDTNRIKLRKGFTRKASIPAHSAFCEGGPCLFISGNNICRLGTDFSHTVLGSISMPDRRMRYVQAPDDMIYFGNGKDKGIYDPQKDALEPWVSELPEVGPTLSRIDELKRRFFAGEIGFDEYSSGTENRLGEVELPYSSPLPPTHLEYYRGRIYTAYDRFLIYSAEWGFSWFSFKHWYIPMPTGTRITMLRRTESPAGGGLFVGTTEGVYFLGGLSPDEFSQTKVSNDPPIEHSDVRVNVSQVMEQGSGEGVMWTSKEGVCFGGPNGVLFDFTKDRVDYPNALSGTALERDGKYLSILTV